MSDVTPDLSQLEALSAVVDAGSFDAAAARLHLTPSAVSQRIKALEQAVGQVVVRRARPVEVTDAGRVYLRLAREITSLIGQAGAQIGDPTAASIPIAVNADSLDTWVLPALAQVPDATFDLRREDQSVTADLLRDGTVMAAITSDAAAVQGCRVTRLGTMRYRPAATPLFVDRWFGGDASDVAGLERAPVVVFDRRDRLQDDYLAACGIDPHAPRHHVPASRSFLDAVLLGMGWGMLPDLQIENHLASGELVLLDDHHHIDVDLYWQQWSLRTEALDAVAAAIRRAAAALT